MLDCIYLAAGTGSRMGDDLPKQFHRVLGKPIMVYALETIERSPQVGRIIVLCHPGFAGLYERVVEDYKIGKVELAAGGETRQESVRLGLERVESGRVLVHEAARPMISGELIDALLEPDDPAVVPTVPVPFTVSAGGTHMEEALDRDRLHNVQLPQVFDAAVLRECHRRAAAEGHRVTEDGMLVFHYGHAVRFVPGSETNLKVTTPLDRIIVEELLRGASRGG